MFYQANNNKDMYHSYGTSNSHIYTEPLYAKQQKHNKLYQYDEEEEEQQQQQEEEDQEEEKEEEEDNDVVVNNVTTITNNCIEMGVVYGLRKRQLSCIEEGDSDSLHSTSLPAPFEMIKDVDESFKQLVQEMNNSYIDYEDVEADQIGMIDESRQYDSDYLDEMNDTMWQSTFSEPTQRMQPMFPDIMATSCYGALNTMDSFNFSPMSTSTTAKEVDAIYATPQKRRDLAPSQSQCSSVIGNGNTEPLYASLMTTSLDLKCMSDYVETSNQNYAALPEDAWLHGMLQRRNISKNLVDEFDVVAEKCLSGAENGKSLS